ncbi:MAG TPA: ATP-binding protein [Leptolyngbyaceae cyanobacterium]
MSQRHIITAKEVNLNNCDEEAIHIPGSIQPHGVLLVLREPQLTILQASNNTADFFGISPERIIKKNISELIDDSQLISLKEALANEDIQIVNPFKLSLFTTTGNRLFDGIIHRNDGVLILELEPAPSPENVPFFNFYHLVRTSASKIQESSNLQILCETIAKEIKQLTGFDRVMLYKFNAEGHGTVVAEEKNSELEPFLGLNYPASDIPKQARRLYCLNWLRLIPDINYQPVEITPTNNPVNNDFLDLSHSALRSVSPLHVEYLQNMGVGASMSISLVKEQKLWGLVACHHYSAKYVSYEVRTACKFLAQVMSLELTAKENNQDYDYKLKLKSINNKLIEYMSRDNNFVGGLVQHYPNLLDLVSANGAAVCIGKDCVVVGKTPEVVDIQKLIKLLDNHKQEIFYTDSLAQLYPEAEKYKDLASGLIAISISPTLSNYVLWFRPEVIQTVNWAGNPNEAVEIKDNGKVRLSPRKSFQLWKETVKLKSLPWKQCEIEAALELKNAIITIVLRQVDELAKLNAALQESEAREREKAVQLEQAIKELKATQTQLIQTEKMSALGQLVAGVAHEINNPINFIYGNLSHADEYTQELINLVKLYRKHFPSPGDEISAQSEEMELEFVIEDLPKLLSSMKVGAERIRDIVQGLRNFSRLDESEKKFVDIHEGIDSTLLILGKRLKPSPFHTGIQVIKKYSKLPHIECYASQLNQVFMNIITNAIDALEELMPSRKLIDDRPLPKIIIRTELINENWVKISIKDNGPGISQELQKRLFDPFFTTKTVGKGSGIGLAISYSVVVEKHGGKLSCVSVPGNGAELIVELPLKATKS